MASLSPGTCGLGLHQTKQFEFLASSEKKKNSIVTIKARSHNPQTNLSYIKGNLS